LVSQNLGSIKHPQLPGTFWTCNMPAIYKNQDNIFGFEFLGQYTGNDVLLILGGNSYKYDNQTFRPVFPNLKDENVVIIPGAGHWVHSEKPAETINAISDFLLYIDCAPKHHISSVMYGN
jgi:pimeloyl-ACP methyl ester carboxylesterase